VVIQFSDCPKYLPEIVANIFNITTSSSRATFPARMLAHLRSRLLRAAQVSAYSGVSTVAQRAKSHMQSSLVTVSAASSKRIRFSRVFTRVTESIAKIAESKGELGELLLVLSTEVFDSVFSGDTVLSLSSAVKLADALFVLPSKTSLFITPENSPQSFPTNCE